MLIEAINIEKVNQVADRNINVSHKGIKYFSIENCRNKKVIFGGRVQKVKALNESKT